MKKSLFLGILSLALSGTVHAAECTFEASDIPISFDAFTGEGYENHATCKITGKYFELVGRMMGEVRCDFSELDGKLNPGDVYLTFKIASDVPTSNEKSPPATDGHYYIKGKQDPTDDLLYFKAFGGFHRHTFIHVAQASFPDDTLILNVTYVPENDDYKPQKVVYNQHIKYQCK